MVSSSTRRRARVPTVAVPLPWFQRKVFSTGITTGAATGNCGEVPLGLVVKTLEVRPFAGLAD
jgi:hypothetical protein